MFSLFRVNHSKNAIVKPQAPSQQETQREVEEAMRKVKEATMAISASLEPVTSNNKRSRSTSRTRSRSGLEQFSSTANLTLLCV